MCLTRRSEKVLIEQINACALVVFPRTGVSTYHLMNLLQGNRTVETQQKSEMHRARY